MLIHYSEVITKVQKMNFPYLYTDAGKVGAGKVTETKIQILVRSV